MEERKRYFKNIGYVAWAIYCVVAIMFFAPYYNWKYAQQSGFVPWLLGGEIVSTFKGAFWPYFVWSGHNERVKRQQAIAYFAALNHCGSGHVSTNEMLQEAIVRADERSKILGEAEGRKQLEADCNKISTTIHSDLDEASAVVPPPFLAEFHEQCVADNRQVGEIVDQMLKGLVARDNARTESLQGDLENVGKRYAERMGKQLQELGLAQ